MSAEAYAADDDAMKAVLDMVPSPESENMDEGRLLALNLARTILTGTDCIKEAAELIPLIFQEAGTAFHEGTSRASLPRLVQSVDWLEKNGLWVDNIQRTALIQPI